MSGGSLLWCVDSWREIHLKTGFKGACCVRGGTEGCIADMCYFQGCQESGTVTNQHVGVREW